MPLLCRGCFMRLIRESMFVRRALTAAELHRLLFDDPRSERLRRIQDIASLLFQLCGMSFADLAHLEKSALENNILRYNRIKTKTPMSVEVLDSAMVKIDRLRAFGSPNPVVRIICLIFFVVISHGRMKRLTGNISLPFAGLTTA